jgi:hypothetical protein
MSFSELALEFVQAVAGWLATVIVMVNFSFVLRSLQGLRKEVGSWRSLYLPM